MGKRGKNSPGARAIRIVDVARAGNVSVATVSRVLTGSPGVGDETRQRIRALVAELGYHPHDVARRLVTRTTGHIMVAGAQTPGQIHAQPILGDLFGGIEERLRALGYRCTVISRSDLEQDSEGLRLVKERSVDGAILIGTMLNDSFTSELLREEFPLVTIGRCLGTMNTCYVDIDNVGGAHTAVQTLIGLGHERIAHVCGSLETTVGVERLEGYRRALLDAKLEYREDLVVKGGGNRAAAYENISEFLLHCAIRPTGIFVFNDHLALAVLRAVRDRGLRVPDDISLIGFDDDDASRYLDPPLASIGAPIIEMGRLAAEMVVQLVRGEKVTRPQVILPTTLLMRDSVKPWRESREPARVTG